MRFVAQLIQDTTIVEVETVVTDCRDPKDNKFLELAVSGNATAIISGDRDLLLLHPFRDIVIVTPKAFINKD